MSFTPKTLTVTECHQLLDALMPGRNSHKNFRKGLRNYTIALLMLDAGLRVGEVVALQMSDLYYGGAPVENLTVRAEISKGKEERVIPLSERVRNALITLYNECPHLEGLPPTAAAFHIAQLRKPLTTRQVERIIRSAAIRSIGRPIHPHILRHTFASRLMRKTDARTVQELLGHKQMSSTQIYCHTNLDETKKAINQVNESIIDETVDKLHSSLSNRTANRIDTPGAY